MSTYYYIICDETKCRCDIASSTSGIGALGDSIECLPTFLVAHHRQTLRVVYEHEEDAYSEDFVDWTLEDNERWAKERIMPTLDEGRQRREEERERPYMQPNPE